MYLSLAAAFGATAWAVWRALRIVGRTSGRVHGIAVRRINVAVAVSVAVVLALSFAFADTAPMHINAEDYTDRLWLRVANMFVTTATLVAAAATASALFSLLSTGDIRGAARSLSARRHLKRHNR